MGKFRFGFRLLAALTLLAGLANVGLADPPPTAAQLLGYKPSQKGVEVTSPAAAEADMRRRAGEGQGPARTASSRPPGWSRTPGAGAPQVPRHDRGRRGQHLRLLPGRRGSLPGPDEPTARSTSTAGSGPSGSKWGVDLDGDGKIDSWTVISPEEVSQELLAAVLAKDQKRFEALLMLTADLDALGLPAAEAQRIQAKLAAAPAQFQKTCKDLAGLKPADTTLDSPGNQAPADDPGRRHRRQGGPRALQARGASCTRKATARTAKHDWIQIGRHGPGRQGVAAHPGPVGGHAAAGRRWDAGRRRAGAGLKIPDGRPSS